jgi:CRP/FNR family cyclic AMP-dependent transcriptional regulator
MKAPARSVETKSRRDFDVDTYLKSSGPGRTVVKYRRGDVVFARGDPADDVRYIQHGAIKLAVLSPVGKEAVVAMLAAGDFFGEGTLAGQTARLATASAAAASSVLVIEKSSMVRLLRAEPAFLDRFISFMLTRNMRIQADLVDQLFNSSEKRLARMLWLLTRSEEVHPHRVLPRISQETLAGMIGSTRSRVNFFMNKFRRLGLIEYRGARGLTINRDILGTLEHRLAWTGSARQTASLLHGGDAAGLADCSGDRLQYHAERPNGATV